MSFRFWHRVRLAPGLTLNLSKSSASLSIGPRGAKYTIGPRGQRFTAGIPGSGLFYSVHVPHRTGGVAAPATGTVRDRLDPGFFRRLVMSSSERLFLDGLRAVHDGQEDAALVALEQTLEVADARWLSGVLRLKRGDLAMARTHLESALRQPWRLGTRIAELNLSLTVSFPVAPWVVAHARPGEAGTLLALVEAAQSSDRVDDAMRHLERLLAVAGTDPVAKVSFAELVLDRPDADRALLERVVVLTADADNATAVHAAMLLYRGRALARLGLPAAAQNAFNLALRRKADRPADLLHQIRYERARLYEERGRRALARGEFERLFADAPDFADVRQRLESGSQSPAHG